MNILDTIDKMNSDREDRRAQFDAIIECFNGGILNEQDACRMAQDCGYNTISMER